MARLLIPEDFASQTTLLNNIVAQNTALGTNSPITSFLSQNGIVLTADVAAGAAAQTHETNRTLLSKQSENFRQLRDNAFATPWQIVTGSAQFLKRFYKNNTKELGNWALRLLTAVRLITRLLSQIALHCLRLLCKKRIRLRRQPTR